MKIIDKKLAELTPYANNPRLNDGAVDAVAASIKAFGFKVPIIIDKDGVIVAGHTRLKAAQKLGLKTVPCIVADDLTPEQVKAFRLADNKVGELAEWDLDTLKVELGNIGEIDLSGMGFDLNDDKPAEDIIEPTEKEINGYQFVHYMVTVDINHHDKIIGLINQLKEIEGVEVESTLNG